MKELLAEKEDYDDSMRKLQKNLDQERVFKEQAVNKLAQVISHTHLCLT